MTADVLLIRPGPRRFASSASDPLAASGRAYPIGLLYLAAAVRRAGHSVELLDAWAVPRARPAPLPRELRYLEPLSDLRYCGHPASYVALGMSEAEIASFLRARSYPVIGISSMFSGDHPDALRLAAVVKRLAPESAVVLGGAATTSSLEDTLAHPAVDFVVAGEAEASFPRLVAALLSRDGSWRAVPGVGYKRGGKPVCNARAGFIENLDALESPAYDLADPWLYRADVGGAIEPYASLFTSRGCPHLCDFCTIYLSMGRRFRAHSPERVVAEIKRLRERHDVRVFQIEDDNFAFDPERAKSVLRLVIREFGERRLVFRDPNGLTALSLRDRELVSLMGRAGFDRVMIALESSDADVRRVMKKPGTVGHFARAMEACAAENIEAGAFTIVGLPYSTVESDVETQLFGLSQPSARTLPVGFYPIPGTEQHRRCVESGWLRPEPRYLSRLRSDAFAVERPGYSRREALTLVNLASLFNALKRALGPDAGPGETALEEAIRRHHARHPVTSRVDARAGRAVLNAAPGATLAECDRALFQAQTLLERGVLLRLVSAASGSARFEAAKPSRRVLDAFLAGLPERPLRYASGGAVRIARMGRCVPEPCSPARSCSPPARPRRRPAPSS